MTRPLLLAIVAVLGVIFVSWMLGELLRQRGSIDTTSRKARRKATKSSDRRAGR